MPETLSYPGTASSLPNAEPEAARRPRPVRVCFLIDQLTSAGTETQLVALIRRLDRRVVRPYLCLLRGNDPVSEALEPDDCPIVRLGVGSVRHAATVGKLFRLWRFLRRERIDVLQTYFPESTYLGVPVGWLAGVPHLVRTRNNVGYWMTPWHRRMGRFCNWFSRVTVANCGPCRDAVLADEGLSPDRVVVLENGVDLDRFPTPFAPRPSGTARRVGVLANLRPVKGLDVFTAAAAQLAS
jgi:L-malate glycosyltransferase